MWRNKLDYFSFYKIPVSFFPDEQELKKTFYSLSKTWHPDFYITDSAEKQQEAMELSTLNNKAYAVLSSFPKRLEYILQYYGLLEPGDRYALPQSFLMQMMDINEALLEQEIHPNAKRLAAIRMEMEEMEQELDDEIRIRALQFDKADELSRKELLTTIKDLYYRKKYLLRIRDSLNKFAG